MPEAPDLGNEDGVMPKEQVPGKPTSRRYSPEEKAAAVRMVRTDHGDAGSSCRTAGYVCGDGSHRRLLEAVLLPAGGSTRSGGDAGQCPPRQELAWPQDRRR